MRRISLYPLQFSENPLRNKIVIGTVQFGLDYGVTNSRGKIPLEEVSQILVIAKALGISYLDTAAEYGNSEEVLGIFGVTDFKLYSKLRKLHAPDDLENLLYKELTSSLDLLGLTSLEGFYIHDPNILRLESAEKIYICLQKLKEKGYFKKLGLSIYKPEDYIDLHKKFKVDLIQFPVNIYDQRFIHSDQVSKWKAEGVELHGRSIFLQGILLKDVKDLPDYFKKWNSLFLNKEEWRESQNLDHLSSCLYPILSCDLIDKIVLGIDGMESFLEIIESLNRYYQIDLPTQLGMEDPDLIYPYLWK